MDTLFDPLLPAFQLLWKAAKTEKKKFNVNDCVNANFEKTNQNDMLQEMDINSSPETSESFLNSETIYGSDDDRKSEDAHKDDRLATHDDSVVVCALECDHGDKMVRQIVHDGSKRTAWSRAEDLFVDWLNSDLTSQHAQRIDVTMYFCRIPISTCSDGICLWVKNLRDEGKEVNIKVRVASLGPMVTRSLGGPTVKVKHQKGRAHEIHERLETEDTISALRRLAKLGAQVELMSAGDWMHLISLLTDRASLQAMDLKRGPSAEALGTILQRTQ